MHRRHVGIETLLILVRKARLKIRRYESARAEGDFSTVNRLLPQILALRQEMGAAYRGACDASDADDHPDSELRDEVKVLMRVLAPGRQYAATEVIGPAELTIRKHRRRTEGGVAESTRSTRRRKQRGNPDDDAVTIRLKK
jgi:hypothetical protein